jgi:DUF2934 family protein
MSQIAVVKVKETKFPCFVNEVENLRGPDSSARVSSVPGRGQAQGSPEEDWLEAERELTWAPNLISLRRTVDSNCRSQCPDSRRKTYVLRLLRMP